jgi:hypothetical protein
MSNKTVTVIIPVHELNDVTTGTLKRALDSIKTQRVQPDEVMIVAKDDAELIKSLDEIIKESEVNVVITKNSGKTDFASQINLGVEQLKTTHFTLLEYDDELTPIWIDNVKKYLEAHPEMDMFLPIIVDLTAEGEYIGFSNEPVWANEFSEKLGEIDNATVLRYTNFNIDGMVISKEKYEEIGGLKPSMKLTFPYEFLLRITNFSGRVMVVPKIGYKHCAMREGGLFHTYGAEMTADERRWWVALAKKEYFHVNDRHITYEQE